MPPISIMFKPASSACNLRCEYCFYHELADNRAVPNHGLMSEETLSDALRKAFDFTHGNSVMLSFQGGEPLLRGKDFFRSLQKTVRELNVHKSPVFIGVQTNGTLIDNEWCEIFKAGNYLIGLSLDGDETANALRVDAEGNPTFDRVLQSAKLLQKYKVNFNILSVITKPIAERINSIYGFFKKQSFKHLQFIPCLKPLNGEDGGKEFYLDSASYCDFLKKCFTLYTKDYIDGKYVSIRQFDNFVRLAHHRRAEQCGMNGHCCHQFVIEADGEVYPCDFYCADEYSMGNIADTDFAELSKHPVAVKFIEESIGIDEKCTACTYYSLCKNGCKRERLDVDKCEAFKEFFPYALPHLRRMN